MLTALTVNVNVVLAVSAGNGVPESVNVKVIFDVPLAYAVGVSVAVQFGAVPLNTIFPTGTKTEFEVVALIEVVQLSVESTSVIVKLTVLATSSFVL